MGFKNDDRCLDAAEDDEPIFVLLARDVLGAELVKAWADRAEARGIHGDKLGEARTHARRMRKWREENR